MVLNWRSSLIQCLISSNNLISFSYKAATILLVGPPLLIGCSSKPDNVDNAPTIHASVTSEANDSIQIEQQTLPISVYPQVISKDCGDGEARLFDECSDQTEILKKAIAAADQQNKNVLVSYGGEWCIWCHVLDRYFQGQFCTFDYQWRDSKGDISEWLMQEDISTKDIQDAIALNNFVANSFVVAHIDNSYANGAEAIAMTGLDPDAVFYYPYIIVLDHQGKYAGTMNAASTIEGLEVRESGGQEFRGYRRDLLLAQLKALKHKANSQSL